MYIGIIKTLTDERKKMMERVDRINDTIGLLRELDGPSELSKSPMPAEPVKPKRTYRKRKATKPEPKHVAGHRGPRNQFSKYKGVTKGPIRKNGKWKYRAHFWDGRKNISLGMFDDDLLAAAAVADRKGDKAEAARLRAMAGQSAADMDEQAENNPDRPEKVKMVTIYICSHCNTEWKSRPDRCPHCDGATFKTKKVPADSV